MTATSVALTSGRTCGSTRDASRAESGYRRRHPAQVGKLKLAAGRERQKSLLDVPLADADD